MYSLNGRAKESIRYPVYVDIKVYAANVDQQLTQEVLSFKDVEENAAYEEMMNELMDDEKRQLDCAKNLAAKFNMKLVPIE